MNYLHLCDLATLAIGVALMIAGPYMMPAPDWDIPVSPFHGRIRNQRSRHRSA
jgi:hypothetical protein